MLSPTADPRPGLWTLTAAAGTSVVVLSALWLAPHPSRLLFLGAVAALSLVLLLTVPVHVLPTLAMLLVFTVSDRIADASLFPVVTPATAVMGVWLLRRWSARFRHRAPGVRDRRFQARSALVVVHLLMAGWLLVQLLLSPTTLGISWALTYLVAVGASLLVEDGGDEVRLLRRALPWTGAVAGLYAVLQASLGANIVFSPVLRALGQDSVAQHWAVYRSDGSFGHPLVAGLFLAVALAFCIGRWLETDRSVNVALAAACGAGIISTVSRGAYIAAAVGVAAIVLVAALRSGHTAGRARLWWLLAGFCAFAYYAAHTSSYLARDASQEASDSSVVRANLPGITLATARSYHWLGSGPATSLKAAAPYNYQGLRIENSYFQALISLGIPGLVLLVATLVLAVVLAVRLHNLGTAAGLVALAVGLSGFAALDGLRNVLVLLGLLVMLAVHREPTRPVLPATLSTARPPVSLPRGR